MAALETHRSAFPPWCDQFRSRFSPKWRLWKRIARRFPPSVINFGADSLQNGALETHRSAFPPWSDQFRSLFSPKWRLWKCIARRFPPGVINFGADFLPNGGLGNVPLGVSTHSPRCVKISFEICLRGGVLVSRVVHYIWYILGSSKVAPTCTRIPPCAGM